jgi:hypothetical protein
MLKARTVNHSRSNRPGKVLEFRLQAKDTEAELPSQKYGRDLLDGTPVTDVNY